jgi:hypothetical protein
MLVVTPFWATAETDMPIELWKQLLDDTGVTLAAGLEVLLRPDPAFQLYQTNSLETARGAAASYFRRGADSLYLFNYMDSQTAIDDLEHYPTLLREVGNPLTLTGKPRRHVVTFADTWAPGEPRAIPLPAEIPAGGWGAFRLHIGPAPLTGRAHVCVGHSGTALPQVWVNGVRCDVSYTPMRISAPEPAEPPQQFVIPAEVLVDGYTVIEVHAGEPITVYWVEIAIQP